MTRYEIIKSIGDKYLESNIENGEYSYKQAFKKAGLIFNPIKSKKGTAYEKLDIRFVKDNVSVLVETKDDFTSLKNIDAPDQLAAYVEYEKQLTGNTIIAILANTNNNKIRVFKDNVSDDNEFKKETAIRTMQEYVDICLPKTINNKEKVMKNTYALNELLHKHSIPEKIRSQFVGTCLLALKNGLIYDIPQLSASAIRASIKEQLEKILQQSNSEAEKASKISLLYNNVLKNQYVLALSDDALKEILRFIEGDEINDPEHKKSGILPFINDKTALGQDLLNLFFITFNKYVGKEDKNQAFTPDHITDFMSKITKVNHRSRVLDPCCGSGSFLVRAMTTALDDASTKAEEMEIKKNQIFGIEYDENVYGLATTNMLIHGDGNANIIKDSCFNQTNWIINTVQPDVILMNPPYNCKRASMDPEYLKEWKASQIEDPSKGLYFAKWLCDTVNQTGKKAVLAILLPVACAIGNNAAMKRIREEILENNTLDAVFTLPAEIFYPGASASACCMVFKIGEPHKLSGKTFFGYYKDDGFKKKKNLGRVESPRWKDIEKEWISLYQNRTVKPGLSAVTDVGYEDEWLCEAYMQTDYTDLTEENFERTIKNYLSYLIKNGENKYED